MHPDENLTQLLGKWTEGDKAALDELMPLVYNELRSLAKRYLKSERADHTLQPTALVNEVYLRLVGQRTASFASRAQFFGLAAKLMRNILVDHARKRRTTKRGGEPYRISISTADRIGRKPDLDLVALDDALTRLAALNPQHSDTIELRFFGGLTIEETAEAMGLSHATVERDWSFARAWLRREMSA
ncbi:MAG TPA: sigma-70 family RNA polymerase sigma factor [Blastocatellia bacterium]|nr:sigma-70 family RNA polymerase sigma factor [Blastocatellia bacterium]